MSPLSFRFFMIPYGLFLLIVGSFLVFSEQGDFLLWLNQRHNSILDFVFRYITYLGDWVSIVVVFTVLLIRKRRTAFVFAISSIFMLLVSSFMKRVVFADRLRPKTYFGEDEVLNFVDGVNVYSKYSTPSGHTLSAFMVATFLSLIVKDSRWSLAFLFGAILTGLSRIYLLQHFLIDVFVGSLIGMLVAISVLLIFKSYIRTDMEIKKGLRVS